MTPGIAAGARLRAHARVRAADRAVRVCWDGAERMLGPGRAWVRTDLVHVVTADEVARGRAVLRTTVRAGGQPSEVVLPVSTTDDDFTPSGQLQ